MMSAFRNWGGRAAVLLLPITLGACAQYAQQYGMTTPVPATGPLAWDGAGRDPNLAPPQRHARNAAPAEAQLPGDPPSAADADAQLARKLVICSTCIKPAAALAAQPDDRQDVASVTNR